MSDSTDLERSMGVTNPLVLVQSAIDRGMKPEDLGKLLDLSERWEENQAKKAFAEAITDFQRDMPAVKKDRRVSGGGLQFDYAAFDDIMAVAKPLLVRHAIVVTFTTRPIEPASIEATCRVRVGTYSEATTVTVPIPPGKVTNTQLMGQAISYGKRYALCAALNIVVTDEDNDGGGGPKEGLSDKQTVAINELLRDCEERVNDDTKYKQWKAIFLSWIAERQKTPVESLNDVHADQFEAVKEYLLRKLGRKK